MSLHERIAYTCPGHSFYVHTERRGYDTMAGTFIGYQTIAMSIDAEGRPVEWLYDYHCSSERRARHAHYVISKRLSRSLGDGEQHG